VHVLTAGGALVGSVDAKAGEGHCCVKRSHDHQAGRFIV
jgi:hypothetical protein